MFTSQLLVLTSPAVIRMSYVLGIFLGRPLPCVSHPKSLQLSLSEVNSEKRLREEGEGESPRFYQVSKTVCQFILLRKRGGEALRVRCFTHEQKCMITTGLWSVQCTERVERAWGRGGGGMESQTSLSPCFPINTLRTNFPFFFLFLMTLFTSFFEWHMKIDGF